MTIEELRAQREAAFRAASDYDKSIRHSRYNSPSDQQRSHDLWVTVRQADWRLAEHIRNNHTTGADQ